MNRYKIILDDTVPNDGAVRRQMLYVGSKAASRGYGQMVADWVVSDDDREAIRRDSERDDSPYHVSEPLKSRIFVVHPETWEQIKHTTEGKPVDVFRARRIEVKPGVFFTVHEPVNG